MSATDRLLLTFYGDDFTGSTDALEALSIAGFASILFLDPPHPEALRDRFPGVQAVGVAGIGRSLTPAQMDSHLPAIFDAMKRLRAPIFHYKVCSTFDSSPEFGSIGRALDLGQAVFRSPFVPLVVGVPVLRRYCVFGNLFAAAGDEIFRLDRHPTMSRHPVTPMRESDLRVHLAHQTDKRIALFDILHLAGAPADVDHRFSRLLESRPDVVLFDVLREEQLAEIGRLIWRHSGAHPLFAVGSSGVEYALTAHLKKNGSPSAAPRYLPPGPADRMVVMSGSCSPATERQITWAADHGFSAIPLDTVRLTDRDLAPQERTRVIGRALAALAGGRSVVLHSCLGPDDPRLAAAVAGSAGRRGRGSNGSALGEQMGIILKILLQRTGLRRVVVAGGDTSGQVVRSLGISALEMIAPTEAGAPLCRAYSADSMIDGLEIALKGGQVGKSDYLRNVLLGSASK
jgi:uncharacterized protein YgbK (DUF1537 family)